MQQLEAVRKKIATTGDLLSVVKTMKSLAAVNIRHFENAAKGVGEYAEVVDKGWTVFLGMPESCRGLPKAGWQLCWP